MAAVPVAMSKTTEHLFKKKPLVREAKGTQRYTAGYAVVKAKPKKKELPLPLHGTKLLYQQLLEKALHEHDRQHVLTHNQDRLLNRVIEPSERVFDHPDNASGMRSFEDILKDPILVNTPLSSDILRDEGRFPEAGMELRERVNMIADMLGRSDGGMIRLRLHSENLNDELIKVLASRLSRNKFLQTLMIHNNAITNDGIEVLCRALYTHPCIHVICIGDNFLSDPAVTSICKLLAHNKHVSDVNMANKWPGRSWLNVEESVHPYISAKGAKIFANTLLSGHCSLTSLSLQFQRVHDEGACALFAALPYCNLRTLNLTNNCLTDKCCVELANALSANVLLEQLVLATNEITSQGAMMICEGLSTNVFLQALSVAHNQIDDVGMEYFLECLDYNHTLTTLATFQNPSTDNRAEELAHDRKMAYHSEVNDHHDSHDQIIAAGGNIEELRGGARTVPLNTAVGAHAQHENTHASELANRDISTATTTHPRKLHEMNKHKNTAVDSQNFANNLNSSLASSRAPSRAGSRAGSRSNSRNGSRSNSPRGGVRGRLSSLGSSSSGGSFAEAEGDIDLDEAEIRDGFVVPAPPDMRTAAALAVAASTSGNISRHGSAEIGVPALSLSPVLASTSSSGSAAGSGVGAGSPNANKSRVAMFGGGGPSSKREDANVSASVPVDRKGRSGSSGGEDPGAPLQRQNSLVQKQLGKIDGLMKEIACGLCVSDDENEKNNSSSNVSGHDSNNGGSSSSTPGAAATAFSGGISRQPSFRRGLSATSGLFSVAGSVPGTPGTPGMLSRVPSAQFTLFRGSSSVGQSRASPTPGTADSTPPGVDQLHQMAREHSASSPHRIKGRNVLGAGVFGKRALDRELSLSNMVLTSSPVAPGSRSGGVGMNRVRLAGGVDFLDNDEAARLEQIEQQFGGAEATGSGDTGGNGMGSASSDSGDEVIPSGENNNSSTTTSIRKMDVVDFEGEEIHPPSYYAPMNLAGRLSSPTHGQAKAFTPSVDYTTSAAHFDYTAQDNITGKKIRQRTHRTAIQTGSMVQSRDGTPGASGDSHDGGDGVNISDGTGTNTGGGSNSSDSEQSTDGSRRRKRNVRTPLVTPDANKGQITTTLCDSDEFTTMKYADGALAVHEKPSWYGRSKNAHVPGSDAVVPVPTLASIAHKPTHHSTVQHIRSRDLGKTVSVPRIGSSGVMPIKTHSNKYGDSGNHLMYLRASTQADKRPYVPYSNILHNKEQHAKLEADVYAAEATGKHVDKNGHSRPTSILDIAIEYEKAKAAAIAERKTPHYIARKADILTASEFVVNKQRGSMKPPPDYFWKDWRSKMHLMYPEGIDKADKASSIRLPAMELPKSGADTAMYLKIAENNKLFGKCKSPGEVLGVKRTNRLKKLQQARERAAERAEKKAAMEAAMQQEQQAQEGSGGHS